MTTGTAMPTVSLPRPMDHTLKVLTSDARFKLMTCGRRWGKTGTGLLACLRGHGSYRGKFRGAIDGGRIWWVTPNYSQMQSSNIWEDLKRATQNAWVSKDEVDKEIVLPGGGSVTIKSADKPDSLRGSGLDGVFLDEVGFQSPEVWRKIVRPALADKQGWAMLGTTPNGKNWIYKLKRKIQSGELKQWEFWQCKTSENPLITPEEIESVKIEVGPRSYSQEFDAEFAESDGAIFPGTYFEDHIWCDRWPDAFEVSGLYADPSLGKEANLVGKKSKAGDYQAIVFAGLNGGIWYVKAWLMRVPPLEFVAKYVQIFRAGNPTFAGIEANGFQSVLSPLFDMHCEKHNIPPIPLILVTNKIRKELRIQSLDPLYAAGKIKFLRCEGSELVVEQSQMFPSRDYHDDGPDALHGVIDLVNRQIGRQAVQEESEEFSLIYT